MKAFTYKETKTTNMKIVGLIDTDRMVIDVDGIDKDLTTLLSAFNGGIVEIKVTIKEESELDEPTSEDEE